MSTRTILIFNRERLNPFRRPLCGHLIRSKGRQNCTGLSRLV